MIEVFFVLEFSSPALFVLFVELIESTDKLFESEEEFEILNM